MNDEIKVYRDVLEKEQFDKIYQHITDKNFWWENSFVLADEEYNDSLHSKYNIQFVHSVLQKNGVIDPDFLNLIKPIIDFLRIRSLMRVKVNLICRTDEVLIHGFHRDLTKEKSWNGECKSAVFYLNDCNGYTIFKESGMKVKSESNKVVVFPVELEHSGTTCTDKSIRLAINFVYF